MRYLKSCIWVGDSFFELNDTNKSRIWRIYLCEDEMHFHAKSIYVMCKMKTILNFTNYHRQRKILQIIKCIVESPTCGVGHSDVSLSWALSFAYGLKEASEAHGKCASSKLECGLVASKILDSYCPSTHFKTFDGLQ